MQKKCHREMFSLYGEAGSQKTEVFMRKNGNNRAPRERKASPWRKKKRISY
jgi:hypothetical protein